MHTNGFEGEEENLKQMLEIGVISESSSDWASAPVLVRKRDGSVRHCIDHCSLNAQTVKDVSTTVHCSPTLPQTKISRGLAQVSLRIHIMLALVRLGLILVLTLENLNINKLNFVERSYRCLLGKSCTTAEPS